ncbi:MAG TPA: MBL fold metallo-hydrolase [Flavisolibacter sp.]
MHIYQWEDKHLAHFSYAILDESTKQIILVDPARNPQPYLDYAQRHGATIKGIIETHPHADFTSSHLELHEKTGATIYVSSLVGASYPHEAFDEGQQLTLGNITLSALHTPGHSPDSICIVAEHDGKKHAVFTGDTLFIGDCGRPDLREGAGNIRITRQDLAKQMYHSLRDKLMPLPDEVIVYPAHGAGTLCGKALSKAHSSTIGAEKMTNWSLQDMTEEEFTASLLADQPFIPAYFPYDVELNRKGAPAYQSSISNVRISKPVRKQDDVAGLQKELYIVDARDEKEYKKHHLPYSINLMKGAKFETWLGSIIRPHEKFYLAGSSEEQLHHLIERAAAIGYEPFIEAAFVLEYGQEKFEKLDVSQFREHPEQYTIVDVRNPSETSQGLLFDNAITIPLADLRGRVNEIPTDKPVVVHCAAGYRSAAGSSLIRSGLPGATVYDLGEAVKEFEKVSS